MNPYKETNWEDKRNKKRKRGCEAKSSCIEEEWRGRKGQSKRRTENEMGKERTKREREWKTDKERESVWGGRGGEGDKREKMRVSDAKKEK